MTNKINVEGFGGSIVSQGSAEETAKAQMILDKRVEFTVAYMAQKGWGTSFEDAQHLSIGQILEIRAQEGWKNPLSEEEDPDTITIDVAAPVPEGSKEFVEDLRAEGIVKG